MNTWTLFINQASTYHTSNPTVKKCEWHLCSRTFQLEKKNMHKRFCSAICRQQSERQFQKELA